MSGRCAVSDNGSSVSLGRPLIFPIVGGVVSVRVGVPSVFNDLTRPRCESLGTVARHGDVDPPGGGAGRRHRRDDSPGAPARHGVCRARTAPRDRGAERAQCARRPGRRRRRGGAPHGARVGADGAAHGSAPAVYRGRGRALWRRPAGPARAAGAGAPRRGRADLRWAEEGVLRVARHAVDPRVYGPAAHPHAGAIARASAGRTRGAARARPRARR